MSNTRADYRLSGANIFHRSATAYPDPLNLAARSMDLAGAALSRRIAQARPIEAGAPLRYHRAPGSGCEDWAWQQARPAGHDGGAGR